MIQIHETPAILKQLYPRLIWNKKGSDHTYLTFDDGPHPIATPKVLDILDHFDAKATFFFVGENIKKHPELVEQVLDKGHLIANHTLNHMKGWNVPVDEYLNNINACDKLIKDYIKSEETEILFRPPYGRIKRSQISALSDRKIIMWSHLAWDFDQKVDVKRAISKLSEAKPGSILVFHDSQKALVNLLSILPNVLERLKQTDTQFTPLND
jgi:peptidoglycan/xylan/chitin deacetylase (PgdA/CDA1 family)